MRVCTSLSCAVKNAVLPLMPPSPPFGMEEERKKERVSVFASCCGGYRTTTIRVEREDEEEGIYGAVQVFLAHASSPPRKTPASRQSCPYRCVDCFSIFPSGLPSLLKSSFFHANMLSYSSCPSSLERNSSRFASRARPAFDSASSSAGAWEELRDGRE